MYREELAKSLVDRIKRDRRSPVGWEYEVDYFGRSWNVIVYMGDATKFSDIRWIKELIGSPNPSILKTAKGIRVTFPLPEDLSAMQYEERNLS